MNNHHIIYGLYTAYKTTSLLCRYLVLIFDEIKIKEGLVYHKHTGQVVGFVHLGEVNNDLETLERRVNGVADEPTIATHMLSLMVRGIHLYESCIVVCMQVQ